MDTALEIKMKNNISTFISSFIQEEICQFASYQHTSIPGLAGKIPTTQIIKRHTIFIIIELYCAI